MSWSDTIYAHTRRSRICLFHPDTVEVRSSSLLVPTPKVQVKPYEGLPPGRPSAFLGSRQVERFAVPNFPPTCALRHGLMPARAGDHPRMTWLALMAGRSFRGTSRSGRHRDVAICRVLLGGPNSSRRSPSARISVRCSCSPSNSSAATCGGRSLDAFATASAYAIASIDVGRGGSHGCPPSSAVIAWPSRIASMAVANVNHSARCASSVL